MNQSTSQLSNDRLSIMDHAIIDDALTLLRDKQCPIDRFRRLMDRISRIMAMRLSANLSSRPVPVDTPLETTTQNRLTDDPVTVVPILRAGLGMVNGFLDVIPTARIGHIGVYRDSKTHQPVEYLNRLPSNIGHGPVIILDPMVATGGSGAYVTRQVLAAGAKPDQVTFCAIVSVQTGIDKILQTHEKIKIITAAMDAGLDDQDYIRPGLGDAGDRLFGTDH